MKPASLKTANRLTHKLYAEPLGEGVFAAPMGSVQSLDPAHAAATFVISTINQDRDGDIIEPTGCISDAYAKNPVNLWNHDDSERAIGTSARDGSLSLIPSETQLISTCYFHQKTRLSAEVCDLTLAGILKAASIGFKPRKYEKIFDRGSHVGHRHTRWELVEWSVCNLGANGDALRLRLDRGQIKTKRLIKDLEIVAAQVNRSQTSTAGLEIPMARKTKSEKPKEEETSKDDDVTETDEMPEEDHSKKPGARTLADLHGYAKAIQEYCKEALHHNEDEGVVGHLQATHDRMGEWSEEMKSLAGERYKGVDLEKIHPPEETEGDHKEPDADDKPKEKKNQEPMSDIPEVRPESTVGDIESKKLCKACSGIMRKAMEGMYEKDQPEEEAQRPQENKPEDTPAKKDDEEDEIKEKAFAEALLKVAKKWEAA